MMLTATDISLVFLGILIVFVLLEVRKLGKRPEPVSHLEQQFERLTRHMERIGVAPPDLELPGGAVIVEAGQTFETISEQLERIGRSAAEIDAEMVSDEAVRRLVAGLPGLQADLREARERLDAVTAEVTATAESLRTAGSALKRMEVRLEKALAPAGRTRPPAEDRR